MNVIKIEKILGMMMTRDKTTLGEIKDYGDKFLRLQYQESIKEKIREVYMNNGLTPNRIKYNEDMDTINVEVKDKDNNCFSFKYRLGDFVDVDDLLDAIKEDQKGIR